MPIASDPRIKTTFSLAKWSVIPLGERPAFLVKYMTAAEVQQHRQLMEESIATNDNSECWRLLWQAMQIGIVGWKNIKNAMVKLEGHADGEDDQKAASFNEDNVYAALTNYEKFEVAESYPSVVRCTQDDKKKSDSL